jgi:hypothetical protein
MLKDGDEMSKFHINEFSIAEVAVELPSGPRVSTIPIGDQTGSSSPVAFHAVWPPHCQVAPHTHAADYCEIILAGSQKVSGKWFNAGDVRVVTAGTRYGPLVAGPDGCTLLIIFPKGEWLPIPVREANVEGLDVSALIAAS